MENDVVVSVQTQNTRGWHKANTDGAVVGRQTIAVENGRISLGLVALPWGAK